MTITLPPLPYGYDALAPHISEKTMHFHYDKHHKGYVDKLNELIKGGKLEKLSLEDIVVETRGDKDQQAIFNNAAQIWNHTFYWESMRPANDKAGAVPSEVKSAFGDAESFGKEFAAAGVKQFGSGWVWLVADKGKLKIMSTGNADLPKFEDGVKPLLVSDVWEHAYYLDYQNLRPKYLEAFVNNLINWDFVAKNLK